MPTIKRIDKDPKSQRRRPQLWETFGEVGINPTDIKDGKGVYYAIVRQEQVELVISEEVKEIFKDKGYDVMIPIEYDSMRSVVIRHIDKVINEYTYQEVTESINNANEWAEVEQIHRILTTGRLLKVKFKSAAMVQNALTQGIIVLHQKINPKNIEKEIFIRLTPCYNCFRYNHRTRECPLDQQILCSYCSQEGHKHNQCTSQEPKCINCGGRHRMLAAVCKVRRDIIKEKGKEIRTRSRSRSANRHTYAGVTTGTQRQTNIDTTINQLSRDEAKTIITKIMASIAYAHYIKTIQPGSFQNTVDEMFVLNNLPKVKFPTNIVTQGIRDLFANTMQTNLDSQFQGATQRETSNERESELFTGSETMGTESHKRLQESSGLSGPEMTEKREKKKKERDKTETTQADKTDTEQKDASTKPKEYRLPPPTQPRSRPPSPGPGATQSTNRKTEKSKVQTNSSNIKVKDVGIMIYLTC